MTDTPPSGQPAWPGDPSAFADTGRCPRCFSALTSSRCRNCGLELGVPLAAELLEASGRLVGAASDRARILDRMWAEQQAAEGRAAEAAQAAALAAVVTQAPDAHPSGLPPFPAEAAQQGVVPDYAAPPAAAPPAAAQLRAEGQPAAFPQPAAPQRTGPKRSGVQIFLLVTGIVLLAVFAIVFLTVAYLFASIEVRVVLTGVASLLVFGVAWLLARRRLPGTAEGVGIIGAVILLIDLAILRGNELFGSGSVDGSLFFGVALIAVAAFLAGVRMLTGLRFASVGVSVLAPFGAFLVVFGLLQPTQLAVAWLGGLVAASLTTVIPALSFRLKAERVILLGTGFGYATAAFVPAALVFDDSPYTAWVAALSYAALAALWALHAGRTRAAKPRVWFGYAATAVGVALALAPVASILHTRNLAWSFWAPAVATAAIFAALCFASRSSSALLTRVSAIARYPVAVVSAAALQVALALGTFSYLSSIGHAFPAWTLAPAARLGGSLTEDFWLAMIVAPAGTALFAVVAFRALGRLTELAAIPVSLLGFTLLTAAALADTPLLSLIAFAVVAAVALAALFVPALRGRPALRNPSVVVVALAALASYLLAWSSWPLWPFGIGIFLVVAVAARLALRATTGGRPRLPAALVSGATAVLMLVAIGWLSRWFAESGIASHPPAALDDAFWPSVAASLTLVAIALLTRRVARDGRVVHAASVERAAVAPDARAIAVAALAWTVGSAVVLLFSSRESLFDRDVVLIVSFALVACASVLWQLLPGIRRRWPEQVAIAVFGPLAIGFTAFFVARAVSAALSGGTVFNDSIGPVLAYPIAAIVAAVIGLGLFRAPTATAARVGWEAATGAVFLLAIASSTASGTSLAWLPLVVAAIVPLLVASGDGNPLTSRGWRRHLAWIALPVATAGLWQFLAFRGVAQVEPYTLPVAGALIAVGALIAFARPPATALPTLSAPASASPTTPRSSSSPASTAGRTALVASGAALAIVPSALTSGAGDVARPIILLVVGAALVALSLLGPARIRGIELRLTTLVAGTVALFVPGVLRALAAADRPGTAGLDVEAWTAPAVVVLVIAGVVWAARRYRPAAISAYAVPLALVVLCIPELLTIATGERATLRALLTISLLAVVHICSVWYPRTPLGAPSEWTSLTLAAIVGIDGLIAGYSRPFELASVPFALALIVAGLIRLDRSPAARTWPHLGAGFALLLVPSLIPDFGQTELWRIVGLGAVAIAVVVLSIVLRWQAPLVIGGSVLIVHALAQLWPWITDVYSALPWWLWLGIGGVLLVVVAARYEHRVRNLRSFVGTIRALR